MRITGYGAGQGGQPGQGRDRAKAFRSRHAVGQRISGRVLRRDPSGLFWVLAGGEELLARLEVEALPGDALLFVVRALEPEIVLQALPQGSAGVDLPGLVQRFRAAREQFEHRHAAFLDKLADTLPLISRRFAAFTAGLEADADLAQAYAALQDMLTQLNTALPAELATQAFYLPWLLPSLRRQEILLRSQGAGLREAAMSAESPLCGALEARIFTRGDLGGLRLLAERPERTGPLQVECIALMRDHLGGQPELLSLGRMGGAERGGVLGELLGELPAGVSGGFSAKV